MKGNDAREASRGIGVGGPWPALPDPGPDNRPGHGARQSLIGITT
jgi:hypothetical protein